MSIRILKNMKNFVLKELRNFAVPIAEHQFIKPILNASIADRDYNKKRHHQVPFFYIFQ